MTPAKTEPFHFRMKQSSEDTGHDWWIEAQNSGQSSHSLISFRAYNINRQDRPKGQVNCRETIIKAPVKRVAKLRVSDMLYRNRWLYGHVRRYGMIADRADDRLRGHLLCGLCTILQQTGKNSDAPSQSQWPIYSALASPTEFHGNSNR